MKSSDRSFKIAGLSIPLYEIESVLSELRDLYREFDERTDAFKANERNPHLCAAGCSHCCQSGAVFAVKLAEAVELALAITSLPNETRKKARHAATELLKAQHRAFATVDGPADEPGQRDEREFSTRVSRAQRRRTAGLSAVVR